MKKHFLILLVFINVFIGVQCKKDEQKPIQTDPPIVVVDPLLFTQVEKDSISTGDSINKMQLMFIKEQPDSIILRATSINISLSESFLGLLVDRMYTTVIKAQGVGIAAPQVGISRRICWVKRYDKTGTPFEAYYNIKITSMSDTLFQGNDGCLSTPGQSGKSWRAIWVVVDYDRADGTHVSEKITHQFTSHIFQHEIDHLDGIVWMDHINQPSGKKKFYNTKEKTSPYPMPIF